MRINQSILSRQFNVVHIIEKRVKKNEIIRSKSVAILKTTFHYTTDFPLHRCIHHSSANLSRNKMSRASLRRRIITECSFITSADELACLSG